MIDRTQKEPRKGIILTTFAKKRLAADAKKYKRNYQAHLEYILEQRAESLPDPKKD